MQNKANFRKSQMNVNPLLLKDYVKKSNWIPGENKPNSKPIKPNFKLFAGDVVWRKLYFLSV